VRFAEVGKSRRDGGPASNGRGRSYYVTPDTARKAVEMALPMIEAGRQDRRVVGSGFLYIVVMDPALTAARAAFEEAILYEHACGDPARWDADYAGFARAKAELSWRTGMDSHEVQRRCPHLLEEGDTTLWGSVCVDGIVVGVSGAFPWFDEAYAGTIALLLRALAKEGRETAAGEMFFGTPGPAAQT
jgi:hypothetical protein